MNDRWRGYVSDLDSGDSGRVNEAVDDIKEMKLEERIEFGDQETIKALLFELDEMAAGASGQQQHLRESKAEVESTLRSGLGRLVEDFHAEFGDSFQPER